MVLLSKVQVVALHGSDDRQSVSEVLRRVERVVTGMAEYIEKEAAMLAAMDYEGRGNAQDASMDIASAIGDIPAADVRENVIRTQGDKLRAASDEELAEWLEEHCFQYGWLDWLKSPAEVMHNANPD